MSLIELFSQSSLIKFSEMQVEVLRDNLSKTTLVSDFQLEGSEYDREEQSLQRLMNSCTNIG